MITIAIVIGLWLLSRLVRRLRAYRASDRLVAAVLKPAAMEQAQPSPDAVKLRERFEEAVATLKQQRRSGNNLYELPWYVIIGAPGSGKTTALVNSGLKFPLESRVGKGALKGVGGTRNCDWWFTDEAIFLDTAGRYTTQDSDASSDSAGWAEFLSLLRKYRKRRPVNGVILTISASDLITQGAAGREAHVEAARHRLIELNRELRIQLPVYLMVTKCDLVAGFTEYFDDLPHEGRAQVWGVTFPYEQTLRGEAPQIYPAEFDALITRLNERIFSRVEEDRDVRRRTKVFGFPQQMAALRDALTGFVSEVFAATRFDQQILLRGVYFTSGTQEGTPIDRLLGAIGRGFGMAADVVAPTPGRGKAYFVEHFLKNVLIGESGLAGVDTRGEIRKAAVQLGAYAAAAVLAVLGVVVWSVSYSRNHDYLQQVSADIAKLKDVPTAKPTDPPERLLPRLNAVRAVLDSADRYQGHVPWAMRWGLYQGSSVGKSARDAYVRELDGTLYPLVAERFKRRLVAYRSEPEKLYEYLKAYLMLGEPKRLDKRHLEFLADLEWANADGRSQETVPTLATHFKNLLQYSDSLRPVGLDAALIGQARSTIRQASIPRIVYRRLQSTYADDRARAVRLDVAAGMGSEQVIRRRSGVSLSEPVPAMYGKAVFKEVAGLGSIDLVKQFAADDWVWGEAGAFANNPVKLASEVLDLYERDYLKQWDAILTDLELVPFTTLSQTTKALELLAGPSSPLRGILAIIVDNTTLVAPAGQPAPPAGGIAATGKKITEQVGKILSPLKEVAGVPAATPGALVTAHFQPIHRLLEGEPGNTPLDRVLARIDQIQTQLKAAGPGIGSTDPLDVLKSPSLREALQSLQQDSVGLPPVVRSIVGEVSHTTETTVATGATTGVENRFREEVVRECDHIISGRYPFTPTSPADVPLADFGRLFGYGGIFDTFFQANLQPLVDTSQHPWTWRAGTVNGSVQMLRQFEAVDELRDVFFRPGSRVPGMRFTAALADYDASTARFTIDIEGQVIDSRSGPKRNWSIVWPGPTPELVSATFEQRFGGRPSVSFHGPWAWFRFIDAATVQRESDIRNVLTVKTGSQQAQLVIEASTVRNPFATREWQQFRCEP